MTETQKERVERSKNLGLPIRFETGDMIKNINFEEIEDVDVETRTIFLKTFPVRALIFDSYKKFESVIFKYRRHIASRPNPRDRVEMFECKNDSGVYSYDKEQIILEARA